MKKEPITCPFDSCYDNGTDMCCYNGNHMDCVDYLKYVGRLTNRDLANGSDLDDDREA